VKLLTYTTLWPNNAQPTHGVFVENRLRELVKAGVETRVVAPVPWFPAKARIFGRYADFAKVVATERRHGIEIAHPRYPLLPKMGMTLAPYSLYRNSIETLHRVRRAGYDFDAIDAHYFYPDGVAAAWLGRHFDRPVVITARGTDLNLIPEHRLPRRMIRLAAERAAGLITVCAALKDSLVALGVSPERITVLRNGVDLTLFRPLDRETARRNLDLTRPTLLSVGALIPRKGHDLVIRAMRDLTDFDLLIAGEGPEKETLRGLAANEGVSDRVRFLGRVAHEDLPGIYSAADALVLASSREGWANVLLEAMACGTPVIASDVWGTPEVVTCREAGLLLRARTPEGIVAAARDLFAAPPDRGETRAYAERFSWDETTQGQIALFRRVVDGARGEAPAHAPGLSRRGAA